MQKTNKQTNTQKDKQNKTKNCLDMSQEGIISINHSIFFWIVLKCKHNLMKRFIRLLFRRNKCKVLSWKSSILQSDISYPPKMFFKLDWQLGLTGVLSVIYRIFWPCLTGLFTINVSYLSLQCLHSHYLTTLSIYYLCIFLSFIVFTLIFLSLYL